MNRIIVHNGDVRRVGIESGSMHCVVTSPPYYGLRTYEAPDVDWGDWVGQLGHEPHPNDYVKHIGEIFDVIKDLLHPEGVVFLNIGDSAATSGGSGRGEYAKRHKQFGKVIAAGTRQEPRSAPSGFKDKDILGIPWRCAIELQARGWYWRETIIWHKPNPMPEPHQDRPSRVFEPIFMLTKSERYWFEKPKGLSNVWTIPVQGYKGAHFATFPPELPRKCIEIGCPPDGVVFDPFAGSGTTLVVAAKLGYNSVGVELSEAYCAMMEKRFKEELGMFAHYEIIGGRDAEIKSNGA